jgi:hypothetical protein
MFLATFLKSIRIDTRHCRCRVCPWCQAPDYIYITSSKNNLNLLIAAYNSGVVLTDRQKNGVKMAAHDPLRFATGFSAKLATRSRHVCTFFGAGTSRSGGLPDIARLQELVLGHLVDDQRASLARLLEHRNLEQGLSRLRRIAALLVGEQMLDGLTAQAALDLDQAICRAIIAELDIRNADFAPSRHFAAWLARANYHAPVEVFTVNYDLLLETALEEMQVPYFDGFIGNLRARFQTELVEAQPGPDTDGVPAFFARLWKLHGSVNWAWEGSKQIVRMGQPASAGMAAAIRGGLTRSDSLLRFLSGTSGAVMLPI